MFEPDPNAMVKVAGGAGDASAACDEYIGYVNSLYDKYCCLGKGLRYLMSVCTPEEVAKMRELYDATQTSADN